jgi:hypothetical protein
VLGELSDSRAQGEFAKLFLSINRGERLMANQNQGGGSGDQSQRGGSGNFANDPQRASEAGKKGGEQSQGGQRQQDQSGSGRSQQGETGKDSDQQSGSGNNSNRKGGQT